VARDIARDLTAAGGMTDVNGVLQIQVCGQGREIVAATINARRA
jgi:hypothetical protein